MCVLLRGKKMTSHMVMEKQLKMKIHLICNTQYDFFELLQLIMWLMMH